MPEAQLGNKPLRFRSPPSPRVPLGAGLTTLPVKKQRQQQLLQQQLLPLQRQLLLLQLLLQLLGLFLTGSV